MKLSVPINVDQLMKVDTRYHPAVLDQRFHLILRLEPKNYQHRYVEMIYFTIKLKEDTYEAEVVK